MHNRLARGIACLILALVLPGLAPPGAKLGEKYALLVGVRQYDPNELKSLAYSEPDVVALAGVLEAHGYKPGHVVLMTQTRGAADTNFLPVAAHVRKELKLMLQDMEEEDSVLVALAGHGVQFRGDAESYFCPADARLADRTTLISLNTIYKELEACRAGLKVLLVDACRNDPQSANSRGREEVDLESVTRPQKTPPPGGVVAFFSCSEGEKAFEHEDLKHGVFFHYVIEALNGDAAIPGEDEVLIPDLERYVKRHVRDFVRDKLHDHQRPELKGTSRDLVPLVTLARARVPDPIRVPAPAGPETITNTVGMKLVTIPAGEFLMGSSKADDPDAEDDEIPQHRVRISRPFYLGATEVTVGQFRRVAEATGFRTEAETDGKGGWGWNGTKFEQAPRYTWLNPGFAQTDEHPVVNVSWNDAIAFCNKLSEMEGLKPYYQFGAGAQSAGDGYRLPTEAEWEYACRAGTTTRYQGGHDPETLAQVGNIADGTAKAQGGIFANWTTIAGRDGYVFTAPVGRFRANAFGLYDMHGNVWEWCWDWYKADYYKESAVADPSGPLGASYRVDRGGSWGDDPRFARSSNRLWSTPVNRGSSLGFRLARVRSSSK
jgi:formylglycine-generating enzyme